MEPEIQSPSFGDKDNKIQNLKRKPLNDFEEECEKPKKLLKELYLDTKIGNLATMDEFNKFLESQIDIQRNFDYLNQTMNLKMQFDQNFVEMMKEFVSAADDQDLQNIEKFKKLAEANKEFLNKLAKFEYKTEPEFQKAFEMCFPKETLKYDDDKNKLQEEINKVKGEINLNEEKIRLQRNELEKFEMMTNLKINKSKKESAKDNNSIFECELKSVSNINKYIKFELEVNYELNEIIYVPNEIRLDRLQRSTELDKEMIFEADQLEHFMVLIFKIVNSELFIKK